MGTITQENTQIVHTGNYLTLEKHPDNLRLIVTPEGVNLLRQSSYIDGESLEIAFNQPHFDILEQLFEDIIQNSGIKLHSDLPGCFTDSPLITFETGRDDNGEIVTYNNLFWFPEYQVESELEQFLTQGYCDFLEVK